MRSDELVLGIDGGGSKTVAWLAVSEGASEAAVVGRGLGAAANPQAVGFAAALGSLDQAVSAAFDDARIEPGPVAAAVLALAGSDRDENRRTLQQWAAARRLARRFRVVHDALPVLAAGTPEGWGVALIAGTGSFACGQSPEGRSARAGGWGYLLGDEGSGYAIALAGLRAAAQAADGRAPATQLLDMFLERLQLARAEELIAAVYHMGGDRAALAALADVVVQTAEQQDGVARRILDEAAADLAGLVAAVVAKVVLSRQGFPLALAGGLLLGCAGLQGKVRDCLTLRGLEASPIVTVPVPVLGAVAMARGEIASG